MRSHKSNDLSLIFAVQKSSLPCKATVYTQVDPEQVSSRKRWIQTGKVREPK
ncbi:MAG: hypothetical protein HC903_07625 [Methylacidiphilales bacterium]|nr:hypothetical protein [Candidatus Methylacidiphilales bacterium]